MARPRKDVEGADPLPDWVEPQLTQLVESPPAGDGWAHEIKYDGYRIHVRLDHGIVRLLTRSGLDWTERYEEIRQAAATISATTAYLDGELCALRPDGTTSSPSCRPRRIRAAPLGSSISPSICCTSMERTLWACR
jgi:ATP-dependent DNA ligase